ncbi:MAG: hypothetical protein EOM50_10435 [Erysipelotrichia bacterium]|nr:hypothetical protein [Erysipelotrichia bacterium]
MRLNIDLTGIANNLISNVPVRKRGQAISCILSHALINGNVKDALSSMFNDKEMEHILGETYSVARNKENITVATMKKNNMDEPSQALTPMPEQSSEPKFRVKL